jgi:hypothetical protein
MAHSARTGPDMRRSAERTGGEDREWGYVVTADGRVVKATRRGRRLVDGRGRPVEAPRREVPPADPAAIASAA